VLTFTGKLYYCIITELVRTEQYFNGFLSVSAVDELVVLLSAAKTISLTANRSTWYKYRNNYSFLGLELIKSRFVFEPLLTVQKQLVKEDYHAQANALSGFSCSGFKLYC